MRKESTDSTENNLTNRLMDGIRDFKRIIAPQPSSELPARPASRTASEPMTAMIAMTTESLRELHQQLFESIDDALFDRASRAHNNQLQNEYFDGMRELRKRRESIRDEFVGSVERQMLDFTRGQKSATTKPSVAGKGKLSLVEDKDLEEQLALVGAIAKAETRLNGPCHALNLRLAALGRTGSIDNAMNPMGPAHVCEAFQQSMADVDLPLSLRIIVYKFFDRQLVGSLERLYERANDHLIGQGVLPQLPRQHVPRSMLPAHGAGKFEDNNVPMISYPAADARGMDRVDAEIYESLRSILAMRPRSAVTTNESENATIDHGDLFGTLEMLQRQASRGEWLDDSAESGSILTADDLKRSLLSQATIRSAQGRQISAIDEDTIDLVGLLFEFIVQDRNLPAALQAMLGRLQIPFIKTAMLDRHLFTQKTHPARQLLENMAGAWKFIDSEISEAALYEKIKSVIDALLDDFQQDIGVFHRANADFIAYLQSLGAATRSSDRQTTLAVVEKNKQERIQEQAAEEIGLRTKGSDLPDLFVRLLDGPVHEYIDLVATRHGIPSEMWDHALRFVDAFAWSASADAAVRNRTRLRKLEPLLIECIRENLRVAAWSTEQTDVILDDIRAFYAKRINREFAAQPALPQGQGGDVGSSALADAISLSRVRADAAAAGSKVEPQNKVVLAKSVKNLSELAVGSWVEFADPVAGTTQRAKLSWISPIRSRYLFVNASGIKFADKTIHELAADLAAERLYIIDQSLPLFDRAMSAALEKLRLHQSSGGATDQAEPVPPNQYGR
jgi:Protein of unknown function (DUF1631)